VSTKRHPAAPRMGAFAFAALVLAGCGGDEVVGFLGRPVSEGSAMPAPVEPRGRMGLRGGVLLPGSSSQAGWDQTSVIGLFLWSGYGNARRLRFEFGMDYASAKRNDGFVTTHLYGANAALGLRLSKGDPGDIGLFLIAGGGVSMGTSSWEATAEDEQSSSSRVELGMGVGPLNSSWDVRAAYIAFNDSLNVEEALLIAVSATF
jgi:hypothetical protein